MRGWLWTLILGVGIGAGLVLSLSTGFQKEAPAAGAAPPEVPPPSLPAPASSLGSAPTSFSEVVKAVAPSVVQINVIRRYHQRDPFSLWGDDPLFEQFFGRRRERVVEQPSFGSGVIVDADGNILTNSHVVSQASEIEVLLANGRSVRAKPIGDDPLTDLAMVRIKERDILPARLGDSDAVQVGDWVLAIGSPMGFSHSVTEGIVSAAGRTNGYNDTRSYQSFLQTSAAINPGNSGGPLVNLQGEVIGINTAIASYVGQSAGIGFSIPSNFAREVKDAFLEHGGEIQRGWLGVFLAPTTKRVEVSQILRGSPAHREGLRSGDIVLEFGGKLVSGPDAFIQAIFKTKPGTEIPIKVLREGEEISGTVRVATHPGIQ